MRKKNREKLFKHQILITAISVFVVICSMVGGSYAIFSSTSTAGEYNMLKVGDLEISYVDTGDGYGDVLSLSGVYPMKDPANEEFENMNSYRFSITNTGTIAADFKIKILNDESIIKADNCENNLLSPQYIKYKLDNDQPKLLEDTKSKGYTIYEEENLQAKSSEIHNIWIWIDEHAPNDVVGKHFHGKVVIESIQSGVDGNVQEYTIGQTVTLNDDSAWHVLENSSAESMTVTLLSDFNLDINGNYCKEENCFTQVFDQANIRLTENNSYCITPENGCNMYNQNGSSVIYDSTIKQWLETNYLPKLQQSIKDASGTVEGLTVSLPTMEQLAIANNNVEFHQTLITFEANPWLCTTSYWTRTPFNKDTSSVWVVDSKRQNSYVQYASNNTIGVRPVIVTSKQNIKQ